MRKCIPDDPTYNGLLHYHPGAPSTEGFEMWLNCRFFDESFDMIDVQPWGMIVPGESVDHPRSIFFDVVVDTQGMPAGTLLAVRWSTADGNHVYTLKRTVSENGDVNPPLTLHWSWFEEALGQNVTIAADAVPPDENGYPGKRFEFHVKNRLVPGEIRLADLSPDGILDPHNYPNGLQGFMDPIENVDVYNTLTVEWRVLGITAGEDIELLYQWETGFTGAPGQPYEFVIPAEAYSGFADPRFDLLFASFSPLIRLTPEPGRQFVFSLGGQTFTLPNPARK